MISRVKKKKSKQTRATEMRNRNFHERDATVKQRG